MRLVILSDTHGQHQAVNLPTGDMIIHAGDISKRGVKSEIEDFLNWFGKLDFKYKIFIAGNHDFFFERASVKEIKSIIPDNVIYLNDAGATIDGISFWGSPITPWFYDWAFNRKRGREIRKHWNLIPSNTDVLITHGPPAGILDKTISGDHAGCEELLLKVEEVKPRLHVFGHIHEGYGQFQRESTTFINASVLNERYQLVNKTLVVEI